MALLWAMVVAQGTLGNSLTSVMGPIPAEIFAGKHQGSIFGVVMLSGIVGGAAGPWVAGMLHDLVGSYAPTFWICIGLNIVSAAAIWRAAPRKVRAVAGRTHLISAHSSSS
jgi:MFS family permease